MIVGELAPLSFSETSLLTKSVFSIVYSFDAVLCTCTRIMFYDKLVSIGISLLGLLVVAFFVVFRAVLRAGVFPILIVSF